MTTSRITILSALACAASVMITSLVTAAPLAEMPVEGPAACCALAHRSPARTPAPPSDPVFVVGDSLMVGVVTGVLVGSANTLQERLRATGRTVVASAAVGRTVPQGIGVIRAFAQTVGQSSVAFVGLGTNDLFGSAGGSVGAARQRIDETIDVLRSINPSIRIVWVDVSVERSFSRTARWNQALHTAASETFDVEVCRWRDIVLQHPEWMAGDGVHLTVTGYHARRDALIGCLLERSLTS